MKESFLALVAKLPLKYKRKVNRVLRSIGVIEPVKARAPRKARKAKAVKVDVVASTTEASSPTTAQ